MLVRPRVVDKAGSIHDLKPPIDTRSSATLSPDSVTRITPAASAGCGSGPGLQGRLSQGEGETGNRSRGWPGPEGETGKRSRNRPGPCDSRAWQGGIYGVTFSPGPDAALLHRGRVCVIIRMINDRGSSTRRTIGQAGRSFPVAVGVALVCLALHDGFSFLRIRVRLHRQATDRLQCLRNRDPGRRDCFRKPRQSAA